MNLTYFQNKLETSLIVHPEAVRGMRYQQKQWQLYVSDPEPMAVSVFRLTARTLERASDQILNSPLKNGGFSDI
jgi:hypothetical protein